MKLKEEFEQNFKDALSAWVSGVSVVTTSVNGMVDGITVSSFTSVSLEPPLILLCINSSNRLGTMIPQAKEFGVSILARNQESASKYFATPGRRPVPRFVGIECEYTSSGIPVVKDGVAYLLCEHEQSIRQGDHVIVIGRVTEVVSRRNKHPLLYYRRAYAGVDMCPGLGLQAPLAGRALG